MGETRMRSRQHGDDSTETGDGIAVRGDASRWRGWALSGTVVALLIAGFFLPVQNWADGIRPFLADNRLWSAAVLAVLYILAILLLIPTFSFTLGAGLLLGLKWGLPVVLASATTGACLAFLIARYTAHDWMRGLVERNARARAVAAVIREDGWKIVFLLRLNPLVPFSVQNYICGLTDIRFWHYAAATAAGAVPASLLYVYLGAAGKMALLRDNGLSPLQWGLMAAGLITTLAVTGFVARRAGARLRAEAPVDKRPEELGGAVGDYKGKDRQRN